MTATVILTSAMRANLASLQGTATLEGTIQEQLATGLKINSALDNPSSFFAAQRLNTTASSLSALTDGMAQNIQVIKAANNGITGLTALINQAQAVAQTALSEASGGALATGTHSFTAAEQADITSGGLTTANDTITIQQSSGGTNVGPLSTVTVTSGESLQSYVNDLNAISGISATLVADPANTGHVFLQVRTTNGNDVTLTNGTGTDVAQLFGGAITSGTKIVATTVAPTDQTALQKQYDDLLTQITSLASDSGYAGKNLLNGDTMTTQFNVANTSTLTVNGTKRSASGLGLNTANFGSTATIQTALTEITTALNDLQVDGTAYGNNLAVIQARTDFTNAQIGTLQDGANQLTVVDKNSAGAQLLALQTQQQLGIQSLSLASQANQSVLRLFQ